jgi:hypothetical protein
VTSVYEEPCQDPTIQQTWGKGGQVIRSLSPVYLSQSGLEMAGIQLCGLSVTNLNSNLEKAMSSKKLLNPAGNVKSAKLTCKFQIIWADDGSPCLRGTHLRIGDWGYGGVSRLRDLTQYRH